MAKDALSLSGKAEKGRAIFMEPAKSSFDESIEWRKLTSDPLLSVTEIAKAFGCSTDTIRRQLRAGRLAAVRCCGRVKIRRSQALKLLRQYEKVDDAKTV